MFVCMFVCMFVRMFACMFVYVFVCKFVCKFVYALLMCVIETVPTQKLYKFCDQQHAHFRNTARILCHSLMVLLVVSNISPSIYLCGRAIKLADPCFFQF